MLLRNDKIMLSRNASRAMLAIYIIRSLRSRAADFSPLGDSIDSGLEPRPSAKRGPQH